MRQLFWPFRPYIKAADKPGLSAKLLKAKIGQVLPPIEAIIQVNIFLVLQR